MGGGTWAIVPALGHSPQQMMLFDPVRRWLFAADAAYPEIRPYLEWGYTPDPISEYVDTLARVDALAPLLFIPGHGRPDPQPDARIDSARAAIEATSARVAAEVGPDPRSAYEITCRVAGDEASPDARGSWLSVCLSVLDHLEARGEVASRTGSDGVRRSWLSSP
jgi:glyoxylase-like metal-dependent hydrolase (beta-lactamase superfamily II)